MTRVESEWRQGWTLVLAAAVGIGFGLAPIPFYTIGVFVQPLSKEFGWSPDDILLALLVISIAILISAPLVGMISDRWGVRRVTLISIVGLASSLALIAANPGSLPLYYANYALLGFAGAGTLPITWTRPVVNAFREHRGLALSLSLITTGVFGSVAKILAAWLIETGGWRAAYLGLACLPLLLALPVAIFFFRERRPDITAEAIQEEIGHTYASAIRTRSFWIMAISLFLITACLAGMNANLERFFTTRGIDMHTAVWLASLIGVAVFVGRPLGGWMLDNMWAPAVACLIMTPPTLAFVAMSQMETSVSLLALCVLLMGIASGVEYELVGYLVSRYFGQRAYSTIYGSLYVAFSLGVGVGPYAIGRTSTAWGDYDSVLLFCAFILMSSTILLLTLGRYPVLEQPVPPDTLQDF